MFVSNGRFASNYTAHLTREWTKIIGGPSIWTSASIADSARQSSDYLDGICSGSSVEDAVKAGLTTV